MLGEGTRAALREAMAAVEQPFIQSLRVSVAAVGTMDS
jgi:hypothetical protein